MFPASAAGPDNVQTWPIYATLCTAFVSTKVCIMKRSFLGRLQRTALASLSGALLLLVIVPILQLFVLGPQGYGTALATPLASLRWIAGHSALFLLYRLALLLGFVLLLGLPFALFRIIVAQEIVGRAELAAEEGETEDEADDVEKRTDGDADRQAKHAQVEEGEVADKAGNTEREEDESTDEASAYTGNGMPAFAWRGKGFAVIAAWAGMLGLLLLAGGTLASTIYLWSSASTGTLLPDNFASVTSLFALLTYTAGGSLLALALIFFGIVIARSGRKLWPDSWVFFGYVALAIGAIASGSAVQVALAPLSGQASLTTPTILLFAIWSLWFGGMVIRLRPE